jgi:16S rRNA C967 or C1407 C5-methylase (RsmB/RsmF family)/NOL1/NOP2/fmu family ribosome biogenesis protein
MKLPEAFENQLSEILGEDFGQFKNSLSSPSPVSIRLNPLKPSKENSKDVVLWNSEGRYLEERPVFTLDPLFHAGAYYVQEASSMFLQEALKQSIDLSKSLKVLDLCAAPGGKSTLIASLLKETDLLVANEVIKSRVGVLKENLQKWGFPAVIVSNQDPETFADLEGFFDIVLVDAPCSGEGLFRKDPGAVNEWTEDSVQMCSARQKRILRAASMLVAPRGVLIYSTCTYNSFENNQNASWLTQTFDFKSVRLDIPAEWGIEEKGDGYQFYPHRVRGEGFFLSVFKQQSFDQNFIKARLKLNKVTRWQREKIRTWIKPENFESYEYFAKNDGIIVAIHNDLQEAYGSILRALDKRSSGLEIGMFKGDDFIPLHGLALSTLVSDEIQAIEVDRENALKFLKKENFDVTEATQGWGLVRYEGLNLGWIKVFGDRVNNYLPKEWRIRMEIE